MALVTGCIWKVPISCGLSSAHEELLFSGPAAGAGPDRGGDRRPGQLPAPPPAGGGGGLRETECMGDALAWWWRDYTVSTMG